MLSDFAKEKVFWTKKMNLRLVKFIKSRRNIWDSKHPRYTAAEYRDQTYAEFASKYGDKFSGQAVKDRWTSIRSTFRNYLKKYNAGWARGDGEEYKVNWYLWEPCQFLTKVYKKATEDITSTSEDSYENNESQDFEREESSDDNRISEPNEASSSTNCKEIASSLVKIFQGVQNDAFGIDNTSNGRTGRVVANKLSQMRPLDAAKASSKIMEILWLYDENNPINPNNRKQK